MEAQAPASPTAGTCASDLDLMDVAPGTDRGMSTGPEHCQAEPARHPQHPQHPTVAPGGHAPVEPAQAPVTLLRRTVRPVRHGARRLGATVQLDSHGRLQLRPVVRGVPRLLPGDQIVAVARPDVAELAVLAAAGVLQDLTGSWELARQTPGSTTSAASRRRSAAGARSASASRRSAEGERGGRLPADAGRRAPQQRVAVPAQHRPQQPSRRRVPHSAVRMRSRSSSRSPAASGPLPYQWSPTSTT